MFPFCTWTAAAVRASCPQQPPQARHSTFELCNSKATFYCRAHLQQSYLARLAPTRARYSAHVHRPHSFPQPAVGVAAIDFGARVVYLGAQVCRPYPRPGPIVARSRRCSPGPTLKWIIWVWTSTACGRAFARTPTSRCSTRMTAPTLMTRHSGETGGGFFARCVSQPWACEPRATTTSTATVGLTTATTTRGGSRKKRFR